MSSHYAKAQTGTVTATGSLRLYYSFIVAETTFMRDIRAEKHILFIILRTKSNNTHHGSTLTMKNHEKYIKVLSDHGVRPTSNRIIIAEILDMSSHPLSMKDIEDRALSLDKSSISRTLTLFRLHQLVHAIEDGCSSVKYELCYSHHAGGVDDDEHVHFHCMVCHKTFCLHDNPIPHMSVPHGFELREVICVMRGVCPDCQHKKHAY